jgi:hypothetical protein
MSLSQVKRPFARSEWGEKSLTEAPSVPEQPSRKLAAFAPFALAERDRVPLGLIPAFLIPISHAPDDLVSLSRGSNLVWDSETSTYSARPRS